MNDNRDELREEAIALMRQYGSRSLLAKQIGTTQAFLSQIFHRKRYPSLGVLLGILHECGYELKVSRRIPAVVRHLQQMSQEESNGHVKKGGLK